MKTILLAALATVFALHTRAQITFQQGYYIDDSGARVDCLIKNMDWDSNPSGFQYKMSDTSEPLLATIDQVEEFGIGTGIVYKRCSVNIDRSSEKMEEITYNRHPVFNKELLFLKVLVVGKATLYSYKGPETRRYFYGMADSIVHQLIYKKFRAPNGMILINEAYKQQLLNELNCKNSSSGEIQGLEYSRTSLVKFFSKYNECSGSVSRVVAEDKKKDRFRLALRPGLNYSTFEINKSDFSGPIKFEPQTGLRLGLEFEFSFSNNKWAVVIEPTYQYFKSSPEATSVQGTTDYKSIELPLGVRYYIYLQSEAKLFINAFAVLDYSFNSSLTSGNGQVYDVSSKPTAALGAGYARKRFSLEVRHLFGRDILNEYDFIPSTYKTTSLILGYRLNRTK